MTPHSLGIVSITNAKTQAQRAAERGWAHRHGYHWPKGTKLPATQVAACPRVRVADLPEGHLKQRHIEHLEQNQMIASCCRHPENHEVEAFKSHPDEQAPDIYVFHCTTVVTRTVVRTMPGGEGELVAEKITGPCSRQHRFFCVGMTDPHRPTWEVA